MEIFRKFVTVYAGLEITNPGDLKYINNDKSNSYQTNKGVVMNKKLVLAAALVFGFAGLMLANTVKAQDANATDNSAMAADNSAMNADNAAAPAANAS